MTRLPLSQAYPTLSERSAFSGGPFRPRQDRKKKQKGSQPTMPLAGGVYPTLSERPSFTIASQTTPRVAPQPAPFAAPTYQAQAYQPPAPQQQMHSPQLQSAPLFNQWTIGPEGLQATSPFTPGWRPAGPQRMQQPVAMEPDNRLADIGRAEQLRQAEAEASMRNTRTPQASPFVQSSMIDAYFAPETGLPAVRNNPVQQWQVDRFFSPPAAPRMLPTPEDAMRAPSSMADLRGPQQMGPIQDAISAGVQRRQDLNDLQAHYDSVLQGMRAAQRPYEPPLPLQQPYNVTSPQVLQQIDALGFANTETDSRIRNTPGAGLFSTNEAAAGDIRTGPRVGTEGLPPFVPQASRDAAEWAQHEADRQVVAKRFEDAMNIAREAGTVGRGVSQREHDVKRAAAGMSPLKDTLAERRRGRQNRAGRAKLVKGGATPEWADLYLKSQGGGQLTDFETKLLTGVSPQEQMQQTVANALTAAATSENPGAAIASLMPLIEQAWPPQASQNDDPNETPEDVDLVARGKKEQAEQGQQQREAGKQARAKVRPTYQARYDEAVAANDGFAMANLLIESGVPPEQAWEDVRRATGNQRYTAENPYGSVFHTPEFQAGFGPYTFGPR